MFFISKTIIFISLIYIHFYFYQETHPGAVLSVLWLFSQVKNLDSLMCNLFQHVLPRLKQKRVAEYLPKVIISSIFFSVIHIY